MKRGRGKLVNNGPMKGYKADGGRIVGTSTKKGEITANNYVLATGGKSRPETGSTGEGFEFLKQIGHTVEESDSALVPVKTSEAWAHDLAGDRKSTRLNSSHQIISYAVFCLKKKKQYQ